MAKPKMTEEQARKVLEDKGVSYDTLATPFYCEEDQTWTFPNWWDYEVVYADGTHRHLGSPCPDIRF